MLFLNKRMPCKLFCRMDNLNQVSLHLRFLPICRPTLVFDVECEKTWNWNLVHEEGCKNRITLGVNYSAWFHGQVKPGGVSAENWGFVLGFNPSPMNFLRMLVNDFGGCAFKSRFRCSRSQIEIAIMKSVWEHQCEWLLIYNHDDLSRVTYISKLIFWRKSFFKRRSAEIGF